MKTKLFSNDTVFAMALMATLFGGMCFLGVQSVGKFWCGVVLSGLGGLLWLDVVRCNWGWVAANYPKLMLWSGVVLLVIFWLAGSLVSVAACGVLAIIGAILSLRK